MRLPPGRRRLPIPFEKYVNKDGIISGGIVVTPDLVWSRLFSYGHQQIAKLLYAAGEYGSAVLSAQEHLHRHAAAVEDVGVQLRGLLPAGRGITG